ncbi:hypothetical protein DSO57_1034965 [Entomophthora muscae]|uniref:Uncharacterized protein n=1 Tax=Entomophthora muscae TaxID=34485 RepID=A0ACC2TYB5_9FUNG|nr:hypothetical protein DSO57_1034965 [Entomophthora muscae]
MYRFILSLATVGLVASADLASCVSNNQTPDCAKLSVDDATINTTLDGICGKDVSIVGCSIRAACSRNATATYCSPFSLWADICASDYAADERCKTYTGLCSTGSVVEQCSKDKPLPKIVSSRSVATSLSTICSDPGHKMPACVDVTCPKEKGKDGLYACDMLANLREVCLTMDSMGECRGWKAMCESSDHFAPACKHSELPPPKSKSSATTALPISTALLLVSLLSLN